MTWSVLKLYLNTPPVKNSIYKFLIEHLLFKSFEHANDLS